MKTNLMQKTTCNATRFMKRGAPTFLTCLGATGVVLTAISAVRATPKALELLDAAKEEKGEDLTKKEVILIAGPAYIPSLALGASTIACIFSANLLNKRHQAAITSAYALVDTAYKDYRNKVKEMLGNDTDRNIRAAIALDKRDEEIHAYVPGYHSLGSRGEKHLFYEEHRAGYFEATIEDVKDAEYHLNRNFSMRGYACLNEFYDFLGLEHTKEGDILGWDCTRLIEEYEATWIDFDHEIVNLDDNLECCIIHTPIAPSYLEE